MHDPAIRAEAIARYRAVITMAPYANTVVNAKALL